MPLDSVHRTCCLRWVIVDAGPALQQHDRPPVPVFPSQAVGRISAVDNMFYWLKFHGPETTCPIFFEGEETWHDGFIINQTLGYDQTCVRLGFQILNKKFEMGIA